MKTNPIAKIAAGCFLTLGLIGFSTPIILMVEDEQNRERLELALGSLLFGTSSLLIGGWSIVSLLARERKELRELFDRQQSRLTGHDENYQSIQQKLQAKNDLIAELQKQLAEQEHELSARTRDCSSLQQELVNQKDLIKRLNEQTIDSIQQESRKRDNLKLEFEKESVDRTKEYELLSQTLLEQKHSMREFQKQIVEEMTQKLKEQDVWNNNIQKLLSQRDRETQSLRQELSDRISSLNDLQARSLEQQSLLSEQVELYKSFLQEYEKKELVLDILDKQISEQKIKQDKQDENILSISEKLDKKNAFILTLQEQIQSFNGNFNSFQREQYLQFERLTEKYQGLQQTVETRSQAVAKIQKQLDEQEECLIDLAEIYQEFKQKSKIDDKTIVNLQTYLGNHKRKPRSSD